MEAGPPREKPRRTLLVFSHSYQRSNQSSIGSSSSSGAAPSAAAVAAPRSTARSAAPAGACAGARAPPGAAERRGGSVCARLRASRRRKGSTSAAAALALPPHAASPPRIAATAVEISACDGHASELRRRWLLARCPSIRTRAASAPRSTAPAAGPRSGCQRRGAGCALANMTPRAATDAATRAPMPCRASTQQRPCQRTRQCGPGAERRACGSHPGVGFVRVGAAGAGHAAARTAAQQRRRVRQLLRHVRDVVHGIVVDEVQHILCAADTGTKAVGRQRS